MKLKIRITPHDILNGEATETGCPIALAGTRALQEAGQGGPPDALRSVRFCPYTDGKHLVIVDPYRRQYAAVDAAALPEGMREWASDFDDWYDDPQAIDEPVPCAFEVDVPLEEL